MESLGLIDSFSKKFSGTNVFVTGHTGFKGSWLALWLTELGANVKGYSLDIPTSPNHFELLNLSNSIDSVIADVRDLDRLQHEIKLHSPKIIFHLAAQSLVRPSYLKPLETIASNVIGTANVLEACRTCESVRAVIIVTSDKCYENKNQNIGYKENDSLGGHDPYSASKACAELITSSYRSSFFSSKNKISTDILVASVRAGNVIGGGDWSEDRLIPDLMRAANDGTEIKIRYPKAVRPWQHVLECLSGYLSIGQQLLDRKSVYADAWNFGPSHDDEISVEQLLQKLHKFWPKFKYSVDASSANLHEASLLKLDCNKALSELGWRPIWKIEEALEKTSKWYEEYFNAKNILSCEQLHQYYQAALDSKAQWV